MRRYEILINVPDDSSRKNEQSAVKNKVKFRVIT